MVYQWWEARLITSYVERVKIRAIQSVHGTLLPPQVHQKYLCIRKSGGGINVKGKTFKAELVPNRLTLAEASRVRVSPTQSDT